MGAVVERIDLRRHLVLPSSDLRLQDCLRSRHRPIEPVRVLLEGRLLGLDVLARGHERRLKSFKTNLGRLELPGNGLLHLVLRDLRRLVDLALPAKVALGPPLELVRRVLDLLLHVCEALTVC